MKRIKPLIKKVLNIFGYKIVSKSKEKITQKTKDIRIEPRPANNERDANGYDKVWSNEDFIDYYTKQHEEFYNNVIDYVVNRNILEPAKTIIEFGCGPGNLIGNLSIKFPEKKFYGNDFSEKAIEFAQNKFQKVTFSVHDIYKPTKKEYDITLCIETLEHLFYPDKALKNILNVAIQTCIITVPDGRIDNYQGHINFWSEESFNVFLQKYSEDWNVRVKPIGIHLIAEMKRKIIYKIS